MLLTGKINFIWIVQFLTAQIDTVSCSPGNPPSSRPSREPPSWSVRTTWLHWCTCWSHIRKPRRWKRWPTEPNQPERAYRLQKTSVPPAKCWKCWKPCQFSLSFLDLQASWHPGTAEGSSSRHSSGTVYPSRRTGDDWWQLGILRVEYAILVEFLNQVEQYGTRFPQRKVTINQCGNGMLWVDLDEIWLQMVTSFQIHLLLVEFYAENLSGQQYRAAWRWVEHIVEVQHI